MSSIGSGGPTSWQAALLQASAKGDETKVRELIREGVLHGDKFKDALRIALQKVAGRGHEPLTRLFLEEGAEVNGAAENEVTALYRAAELGHHKVVRLLLDKGADTEAKDKFKRTVLFLAAAKGHIATVRLLLEAGTDVNVKDVNEQNVMLFLASEKPEKPGRWGKEVVQLLLGTHIDLEVKDKDDRTSLLWAAATGKEMLANLLLTGRDKFNANIGATNMRGKTALHLAAENNRTAIVKLLLDNKADPAARSDGGWTALHNAADKGHEEIVKLILEKTRNVNAETSSGMTALHWAAQNGHTGMVKLLLQQDGIRKSCKDSFDTTPMLRAAQNGHLDIVKLLSPTDDWKRLSENAKGACRGFQANVVDFGMENRTFNNKKHSVYDLLYGWDEKKEKPCVTTLVRNIPAKPAFRWIHLPANNMTWVEALITNHFIEDGAKDVEGFKALEKSFGQQHKGPTVHSHFMRPLCQRMHPTAKLSSPDEPESGTEKSAPEIEVSEPNTPKSEKTPVKDSSKSDKKATKADKQGKKPDRPGSRSEQSGNAPRKASNSLLKDLSLGRRESRQSDRSRTPMGKMPRPVERNGNVVLFVCTDSLLSCKILTTQMPYLHYEIHRKRAEMSEAIKRATSGPEVVCGHGTSINNDERMIQAYLRSSHNLQIRRTLDQFYYHGIDTGDRDEDQVVYRYCRDRKKQRKVFMVDQLWLWILGKG
jgi:ankyrin repeat protein